MEKIKNKVVIESNIDVVLDELNNIIYHGDVDVAVGKVTHFGKFIPVPNREISPRLLRVIAELIENNLTDNQD